MATPAGTARAENHAKRNGSELWEVEAVPAESATESESLYNNGF
ncbi:hypothetical protein EDC24_2461 [Aquisalibacillus elongatus]|uniref:Uncharacterized protein n=1 Tax=Aquisalibacillus elongatus TaxID=485577 RepID=A0A3N5C4D6_9BACI|nr:hypothetical protein EDC24_2461 [Aquisalibacillus elongatus]